MSTRPIITAGVLACAIACGGPEPTLEDPALDEAFDTIVADPATGAIRTAASLSTGTGGCTGAQTADSEPYKGNPDGTSCVPNSKWNADVDAGHDMSGADYGAFIDCLVDSGCYTAGVGFSLSGTCYEAMRRCQRHLIGQAATDALTTKFKHYPNTAATWKAFGKGL